MNWSISWYLLGVEVFKLFNLTPGYYALGKYSCYSHRHYFPCKICHMMRNFPIKVKVYNICITRPKNIPSYKMFVRFYTRLSNLNRCYAKIFRPFSKHTHTQILIVFATHFSYNLVLTHLIPCHTAAFYLRFSIIWKKTLKFAKKKILLTK